MAYGALGPEYIPGEVNPFRILPSSNDIMGIIGQYRNGEGLPSPEFAESQIRSQGGQRAVDLLTNRYREFNSDMFADPFKDAANARDAAIMHVAMNGGSVATGNRFGSTILSPPPQSAPAPTTRAVAPQPFQPDTASTVPGLLQRPDVATLQPSASPATNLLSSFLPAPADWREREAAGEQVRTSLESMAGQSRLTSTAGMLPSLQLHNAVGPDGMVDYGKLSGMISQRAAMDGVTPMLQRLAARDPKILSMPSYVPNSLYTHDAQGKVIPSNGYHPILDNPDFQAELQHDPNAAAKLYRAVSDRDLRTDMAAHAQLMTNQQTNREKVLSNLDTVQAHPVTGELTKMMRVKDQFGNDTYQMQPAPLTAFEKSLVDSGDWARHYGRDIPNRGGLQRRPGMTDAGLALYRKGVLDYMGKNPNASVDEASQAVLGDVAYKKQQAEHPPDDTRPGVVKAADMTGQTILDLINRGIIGRRDAREGLINPLLRGGNKLFYDPLRAMGINAPQAPQVGQIPVPTNADLVDAYKNSADVVTPIWQELNRPYSAY